MTRSTKRKASYWIAGFFVLIAVGVSLTFLAMAQAESDVEHIEINEYQGEKLGSVGNFRENSIRGVQQVDVETYQLTIDGLVSETSSFGYAALQTMPHTSKLVTIHCVEGWSVKALWEGIALSDLLDLVLPTEEANTVIFHAADGYTTSLPLDYVLGRNLIIADHINGIGLPPANGFPFQLVAEDKWGYKWIRWLTRIELSDDPNYEGFWETRGYNNDGDADGPKFGN
jgi:DMSO/TMAO reductase YedYZ molybdopterin-dependent catalytic subunit